MLTFDLFPGKLKSHRSRTSPVLPGSTETTSRWEKGELTGRKQQFQASLSVILLLLDGTPGF